MVLAIVLYLSGCKPGGIEGREHNSIYDPQTLHS